MQNFFVVLDYENARFALSGGNSIPVPSTPDKPLPSEVINYMIYISIAAAVGVLCIVVIVGIIVVRGKNSRASSKDLRTTIN